MDTYERVHDCLNRLGLSVTEQIIDGYLESAKDKPFMEILDHLPEQETRNMKSRKVEMKLKYSGIPFRKTLDQFDFSFQPSIYREVLDDLMTMRFIHGNENVVFLGPPGVGKTHLSVALGMRALQSDITTYYISAVKLVQSLRKEYLRDRLNILLRSYSRYALMIAPLSSLVLKSI